MKKYSEWVSDDKYMILNRVKMKDFRIRDTRKNKLLNVSFPIEIETFAVKCSKRGNDVYGYRVNRRFRGLSDLAEETVFFNPKDRGGNKKTRALFVTLTNDTKCARARNCGRKLRK